MVKLRVAVRIIPEDDYSQNVENVPPVHFNGEKRLVVIIHEPQLWQIGTLALEVQRAYKSCYQRDLGRIKYMKDNEDDCDLDPELYVSDLFVDEGNAERDGRLQKVTVKVILEEGSAVREGSVAFADRLDDPRFHLQFQNASRPPVPTFPDVASSHGKRSLSPTDEQDSSARGRKRARQHEIPQSPGVEGLISSIERDGSLELVQHRHSSGYGQDPTVQQYKVDSPQTSVQRKDNPGNRVTVSERKNRLRIRKNRRPSASNSVISSDGSLSAGAPPEHDATNVTEGHSASKIGTPTNTVVAELKTPSHSEPAQMSPSPGSAPAALHLQDSLGETNPNHLRADRSSEARKSPSVPIGLTEEEIRIMKSREGMTQEQYEMDKKRKQLEAKKQASEQKNKDTLPTIATAKTLSDLRAALRRAQETASDTETAAAGALAPGASKIGKKPFVLYNDDSDDDDDDESESDSDEETTAAKV